MAGYDRHEQGRSGIPYDPVIRKLKPETFSGRMQRLRSEKATPEEKASAAAWRAEREREQRLEQMRREIEEERARSDEFYRK